MYINLVPKPRLVSVHRVYEVHVACTSRTQIFTNMSSWPTCNRHNQGLWKMSETGSLPTVALPRAITTTLTPNTSVSELSRYIRKSSWDWLLMGTNAWYFAFSTDINWIKALGSDTFCLKIPWTNGLHEINPPKSVFIMQFGSIKYLWLMLNIPREQSWYQRNVKVYIHAAIAH